MSSEVELKLNNKVELVERPCTCHPDDNPPIPCAKQYAFRDCVYYAKKNSNFLEETR